MPQSPKQPQHPATPLGIDHAPFSSWGRTVIANGTVAIKPKVEDPGNGSGDPFFPAGFGVCDLSDQHLQPMSTRLHQTSGNQSQVLR